MTSKYDERYQRQQIRLGIEKLLNRHANLPPSEETQQMLDGLRMAQVAVLAAQRKNGDWE